jgi:hypothetical protein
MWFALDERCCRVFSSTSLSLLSFSYLALCQLVNKFKKGCRLLTYENLDVVFTKVYGEILSESAQQQHTQATQQDASTSAASGTVDIDEDDDPIDEDLSVDPDPPLSGKVVQHISKHGAARSTATGRGEQRGEQSGSSSSRLSKLSAPSVLPSPPILPAIAQPARVGGAGGGTGGGRESKRKRTSPSLQAMRKSSAAQQQAPSAVEFDVETTSSTSSLSSLAVANSRASAARPAAAGAPASSTRGSSPTPCARHPYNPFRQYPINLSKSDRFFTSWATNLGHRFFLWEKVGPSARFCPVDQ